MTDPLAALASALTGRYRVIREIGAGGMATVYLADDAKHHRQVAVKMLRPELAVSVGADRFLREIEIAAGLQHPNILPLYDSGGDNGVLFYVMPFVDGQSLRDRIDKSGALPIADATRIVREVVDALAYSHARGVVHRDIKPENILLSGAHALVTDFGIAKAITEAQGTSPLTSAGMAMGTPSYMAPEQITAEPTLDHRVDIYALGVMAYELIAGRTPFTGANAQQIIAAHLSRAPEPLSIYRETVPPALEAIIMRCLSKNPADRWQSASDVLVALDAASAGSTGAVTTATSRGQMTSPSVVNAPGWSARRRTAVSVGVGATLALGLGGILWFGKDGRAGTLIGNDILAANDLVLVADFQNRTTDSSLASTVTDAVRVELQQSHVVKVMTQSAMFAGIKRMGLLAGGVLPDSLVHALSEREGAKAFIVGDIARLGGGYQITARVLATASGGEALTARATAADESKLIGAVEALGRSLRKGIGESLRSVSNAPTLSQVTTASLPALRLYSAAARAGNSGDATLSITLAKQALVLDTTFASAWSALYVAYANSGQMQLASDAATHAYALRDRLSEAAALVTSARYHDTRGEDAEQEAAWSRLATMDREQTNYANFLLSRRRFVDAEAMQRRGVEAEPKKAVGYFNLVEAQMAQQKFVAAESTVTRMKERVPDAVLTLVSEAGIFFGRRDFAATAAYLESPSGIKLGEERPFFRCGLNLYRGQLRAFTHCKNFLPNVRAIFALAEFRMSGDTARARLGYAAFLASTPDNRSVDEYGTVIALLADVGKIREAQQLLDEWRARTKATALSFRADSAGAAGAIAAAHGEWDRAATAFLAWNSSPMPSSTHLYSRGLPEAATALARLGKTDSSRVLLERALDTPSLGGGFVYETAWYAQALQQLGDIYESRGDRAKAASYFTKYVELFKDADPLMAAQVRVAQDKLARVSGEPIVPTIKVKP